MNFLKNNIEKKAPDKIEAFYILTPIALYSAVTGAKKNSPKKLKIKPRIQNTKPTINSAKVATTTLSNGFLIISPFTFIESGYAITNIKQAIHIRLEVNVIISEIIKG